MDTFQNAKDTFYTTVRDRLAALNADRTTVVRGAQRPAVVVDENEMAAGTEAAANETFVLRWTEHGVDTTDGTPLLHGRCEIQYAVAGSGELAGMDRGRVLEAMDVELSSVLRPQQVLKQAYDSGNTVAKTTMVFWADAAFGPVKRSADRLVRAVTVDVFAWKEPV